jgi:DNA-binding MarR family transcriptional regulator
MMDASQEQRELILLEHIEADPDVNQATLADKLGVAVGTVNWHIKRMAEKGYIKLKRARRKKLRYIITPEGLAFRAHLTVKYIENSMRLFRKTRQRVQEHLEDVRQAGYGQVLVSGDGDLAEVIRLTCLEEGVDVAEDGEFPILAVRGWKVFLDLPDQA